jgi:hypothetical protein
MNEVLQWAALSVLVLLVLGLFRQVALTMPASYRAVTGGPVEGRLAPRVLLDELSTAVSGMKASTGAVVAFVTENCMGCQRLLADVSEASEAEENGLVIVAKQPSIAFKDSLLEIDVPTIFDDADILWKACRITATPLVVQLDAGGRVLRKEVTHDVRRVATSA